MHSENVCPSCQRAKKAAKTWRNSPSGKEKMRASRKKYMATEKYRVSHRANSAKYKQRHPEKAAAKKAVEMAIRRGDLLKASAMKCTDCERQAEHHHHESYAEEHRLEVVALCARCHAVRHTIKQTIPLPT